MLSPNSTVVPWGEGLMDRISDFIKDSLELLLTPFTMKVLYEGGCERESQSSTLVLDSQPLELRNKSLLF